MTNIFVLNFVPNNCPQCGKKHNIKNGELDDFYAGASYKCECGCRYQYAQKEKILKIADDLAYYLTEER